MALEIAGGVKTYLNGGLAACGRAFRQGVWAGSPVVLRRFLKMMIAGAHFARIFKTTQRILEKRQLKAALRNIYFIRRNRDGGFAASERHEMCHIKGKFVPKTHAERHFGGIGHENPPFGADKLKNKSAVILFLLRNGQL